jgi:hypothetical protein
MAWKKWLTEACNKLRDQDGNDDEYGTVAAAGNTALEVLRWKYGAGKRAVASEISAAARSRQ